MQELDVQPTNPTPYTPAGGMYNMNPAPGSGGLPALSGLTRNVNPMAQALQDQGRGEDKMLVHMTPEEVSGLQALAMQHGTTMTINPNTGLPEAGLLGSVFKKLLPALIGGGLMFIPGVNAIAAAGIVGGGSTLLTGSLKKGLMAGLSAYGGASLARGLGAGVASAATKAPLATSGGLGANAGISAAENAYFTSLGGTAVPAVGSAATGAAAAAAPSITAAEQAFLTKAGGQFVPQAAKTGLAALPGNFAAAAKAGAPKFLAKAAPFIAGAGLLGTASGAVEAAKKPGEGPVDQNNWKYEGPYRPMERRYNPRPTGFEGQGEISFFDYSNPYPGYLTATGAMPSNIPQNTMNPTGFADGGSTSRPSADDIIKKGYIDPTYGEQQLAAGAAPGSVSSLGGYQFIVNPQGRWEAYTPPPPPPPSPTPTPSPWTATKQAPIVIPTVTDTTTKVTDTSTPTRNTEKATTTTAVVANPQAGASGAGVQALPTMYTPSFTSKDDFVTDKPTPYTLGTQMTQKLPELVNMYRTSPGAITAPLQYPGGSFNEQVRAQIAAQQKQPQTMTPLQKFMADYYAKYGAPPTGFGDIPPGDMSYAKGGVHMDDGAFVVDARTVSELGNGSSSAGQELLARLGGRPVKGPGDGVSDSIPANIGGTQEARVARDEVIFPAAAVKKLGGAKKLYALMDKAHKARKKAGRGTDTKLRKGLGAL